MQEFSHIFDWKLLKGSHPFPGPDGGTCITEAAILAAGYDYRPINAPADAPYCFSRSLVTYAICLNDYMPDHLRQELLLPFATRLAFTAAAIEIEKRRVKHIVLETIRHIYPIALRKYALDHFTVNCEGIILVEDARTLAFGVRDILRYRNAATEDVIDHAVQAASSCYMLSRPGQHDDLFPVLAEWCLVMAALVAQAAAVESQERFVWQTATGIFDDCFSMGGTAANLDSFAAGTRPKILKYR